jgi:hypothetical protein
MKKADLPMTLQDQVDADLLEFLRKVEKGSVAA